jgi:histidinol-phosphatase (PHP family)
MSDEEIDASLRRYFDRQIEMARWGRFDVLAHITYPLRYICGVYGRTVEIERYLPQIDRLFDIIIEKGIVLEVNTAKLLQDYGHTSPETPLIERYYRRGGRLVTLGSDAHRLEKMTWGIPETEALLREIGFTELAWFAERKMRKIPLSSSLSDKNPV